MTSTTTEQMRALADSGDADPRELEDALRVAADQLDLVLQQRDALAEVVGIEPEWTEDDA